MDEAFPKKQLLIVGGILVLLVAGMFIFAHLKKEEIREVSAPEPIDPVLSEPYAYIDRIEAKHFYEEGTHTIVGEVPFPTPCELLDWDVFVMESYPEQVRIDFNVINESDTCAQVQTMQRFSITFAASEVATISARLLGRDVILNMIPAAEGESPDEFELFIKG